MTSRKHLLWVVVVAALAGGAAAAASRLIARAAAPVESQRRERPQELGAEIARASALLRQARATNDGRPANQAADVLESILKTEPGQYEALRLFGAVQLSRHRFREALEIGRRARDARPDDAWNYGVMGDALVELGDYDAAFESFEKMVALRPSADAYARVSYARELRGDLSGAYQVMSRAVAATTDGDAEAKAWYVAHAGELLLKLGRVDEAEREFRRSAFLFPNYLHAMSGLGKCALARGDRDDALEIFMAQLQHTPTLDLASRVGDIFTSRGDAARAEHYYELAENLAGPPAVQTEVNLAMFLAEHDRKLDVAVEIARAVSSKRHDIFTDDALAWILFKTGRIDEAHAASDRALRTGTRDERILAHAGAIHRLSDPSGLHSKSTTAKNAESADFFSQIRKTTKALRCQRSQR